jgi:hypothetical protein
MFGGLIDSIDSIDSHLGGSMFGFGVVFDLDFIFHERDHKNKIILLLS